MKKIKQWLVGLLFAIYGGMICCLGIGAVLNFISMMNSTGKEFVGYFFYFLFELFLFLILPYIFFKQIEDGVNEKLK